MPDVAAHNAAIRSIQAFLKSKTSYEVLPVSFKLVMLDSTLTMKGALLTILQNGVVSAPIWSSAKSGFAGLITVHDFVNALRWFIDRPRLLDELAKVKLSEVSQIEQQLGLQPVDTATVSPDASLNDACLHLISTKAHRIALVDSDPATRQQVIVSVLTQYRVLRFVALNCKETQNLSLPISDLGITATDVVTTTMDEQLKPVVTTLSKLGVSALPVVDENGVLLNMFELSDVLSIIKSNGTNDLDMTVGEALMRRPEDFMGVLTCRGSDSLSDIMETIRRSRLLRLFVVDDSGRLMGIITLSDILRYICLWEGGAVEEGVRMDA